METQDLEKYIELTKQIKELEEQKKALATNVTTFLIESKAKRATSLIGMVTLAERVSWKYTKNISQFQSTLQKMQKEEQKDGSATKTVTNHLRVKLNDK